MATTARSGAGLDPLGFDPLELRAAQQRSALLGSSFAFFDFVLRGADCLEQRRMSECGSLEGQLGG